MTERDLEVAELLEFIVGRCEQGPELDDGLAVCDICANVLLVLVRRVDAHHDEQALLH